MPKRRRLIEWLTASPSHRRVVYKHIPLIAPELELQGYMDKAMRTAFKLVGYGRRVAKKKGFSDDLEIFSDEVWAFGGAYIQSYVSCKVDGSD
ncbi:hypothetical protein DL98DRAFT_521493 [Cadophora sp. DSE1049]|nr:hypothetical protein DL98DRAFT_521493 [Cadophora sp. DSE1049]